MSRLTAGSLGTVSASPSGTQDVNLIQVGGTSFSLGQQLAASSIPVVLTAAQITTLTPPAAITGFATSAKQDTLLTELQLKADLTETQPVSLTSTTITGSVAVTGTFWQATQPVSGTITANAGTNLNTSALLLTTDFTTVFGTGAISITTQADNIANTQDTAAVSSFLYAFNGTTWDRMLGNSTDGLLVNLGGNNDVTIISGTITTVTTVTTVSAVTAITNALPAGTNLIGNVGHGKTPKVKTGSASATFTIVAAVASKKIKVYSLSLMTSSTTAVTVTFKDGAAGTAIGTYILRAITGTNFGITENLSIPSSLFETTAATLLEMSFSAAVTVVYNLRYYDDDAT